MNCEYKTLALSQKQMGIFQMDSVYQAHEKAAQFIENTLNELAMQGWEFMNNINIHNYTVTLVFRREQK